MSTPLAPPGAIPLVYVAGPYTQGDPVVNTRNAVIVADALFATGLVAPVVPHLSLLWQSIAPLPYEAWLALDMHYLAKCDALLRLDGPSTGADREVAYAEGHGIPVFTDAGELVQWAKAWADAHEAVEAARKGALVHLVAVPASTSEVVDL